MKLNRKLFPDHLSSILRVVCWWVLVNYGRGMGPVQVVGKDSAAASPQHARIKA